MDRGAWWAALHGIDKSRTRLSDFTFTFHFHALKKETATHSSVLAWRVPGTGEPDGLPSMGSQSRTRLKRLSSSSSRLVVKTRQCHLSTSKAGPQLTKPSKMLLHCIASRLPPKALQRYWAGASLQGEALDPLHQSFYTQGIWQTLIYSKGWNIFSYLCPCQINNHTTKGSGNFWFYRNTDLDTKMLHPSKNNTIVYYPCKTFSEKQGESRRPKSKMLSCFSLLWLPRPEPWLTITLTPLWEPASEHVRLSGTCVLHTCLSVKPGHFWPRGEVPFPCSKIMF